MNKAPPDKPIKWTSTTRYVDLETGEVLTKEQARAEYTWTFKKHTQFFEHAKFTTGLIEHTAECKRKSQRTLF